MMQTLRVLQVYINKMLSMRCKKTCYLLACWLTEEKIRKTQFEKFKFYNSANL